MIEQTNTTEKILKLNTFWKNKKTNSNWELNYFDNDEVVLIGLRQNLIEITRRIKINYFLKNYIEVEKEVLK